MKKIWNWLKIEWSETLDNFETFAGLGIVAYALLYKFFPNLFGDLLFWALLIWGMRMIIVNRIKEKEAVWKKVAERQERDAG